MQNTVTIITGGSSGIGEATALLWAQNGADIVITYKSNKRGAGEVVSAIKKLGRKAIAIQANLNKEKAAEKVVRKAMKKFGRIDILINNAGNYIDGDAWNGKQKIWIESLEQNLVSALSMSKYATEIFQKQKSGIIVNIASTHGVTGHADAITYSAAKAGIINITQSYAKLLSGFGGRANSISPSPVNAGYWLKNAVSAKNELKELLQETSIHRLLEPEEVAQKVLYLCSDKAKDMNGQNFLIQ